MIRSAQVAMIAGVTLIDLGSKAAARQFLAAVDTLPIAPGVDLSLSMNTGMAFGFLQGARWPLAVFGALVIAVLIAWLWREHRSLSQWGIAILIGGASGNLIDRVSRGAVTDFLDLHAGSHHWPTFNLADVALTVGVCMLLLDRSDRSSATASP